jgi:hypothetical protein
MPSDPSLDLVYEFTCAGAPVQAEGTVMGRPFYFRARGEFWRFAVSEDPDMPAEHVSEAHVLTGLGYLASEDYGDSEHAASWMPLEEAARIIRECALEYVEGATG